MAKLRISEDIVPVSDFKSMPKGKARSIRWSARAMRDLDQIALYIARDNPQAARKGINKLKKTVEHAARMPLAARVAPEIQRDDVREVARPVTPTSPPVVV